MAPHLESCPVCQDKLYLNNWGTIPMHYQRKYLPEKRYRCEGSGRLPKEAEER